MPRVQIASLMAMGTPRKLPQRLAARALLIDGARLRQGLVARDSQERVHLSVARGDPRERAPRWLARP